MAHTRNVIKDKQVHSKETTSVYNGEDQINFLSHLSDSGDLLLSVFVRRRS